MQRLFKPLSRPCSLCPTPHQPTVRRCRQARVQMKKFDLNSDGMLDAAELSESDAQEQLSVIAHNGAFLRDEL